MVFPVFLKTCSFETFCPNFIKLEEASNSDMLFHFEGPFLCG